jgi:transcriptional regulator GlxA family with amidase domain
MPRPRARVSLEFIQGLLNSHLRERWSVGRLARAFGVSDRSLHRLVRRQFGVPPMALLRRARLARARAMLQTSGPGMTVTVVALDCGFSHLGRFSTEYARRFGERPSQTLRRHRQTITRARSAPRPPAIVDAVFSATDSRRHGYNGRRSLATLYR